jgi:hypothetical protein
MDRKGLYTNASVGKLGQAEVTYFWVASHAFIVTWFNVTPFEPPFWKSTDQKAIFRSSSFA